MSLSVKIKKRLGDFQLDVDFEAESGIFALLGASGSGKSMTLKCVAGIVTPDEGRIVLDGRTLFDSAANINLPPQKRNVGYLFQNYALFPNMTARQNIESGIKGGEKRRLVNEMIESMYLGGLEDKYPHQLSGGQQQRVALARILASSPGIILLDEPFSALDSYLKWQLEMQMIDTLAQYDGLTLFVSHNRDEVYRMCGSVCVMDNGRSEPVISIKELFENPSTVSAALLSGCKNYSAAEKAGPSSVLATDWGVELELSRPVRDDVRFVGVRAHYVKPSDGQGINSMYCRVTRVTQEPFSTAVMLMPEHAAGDTDYSRIRLETTKEQWQRLNSPEELYVWIDPADIMQLN